MSPMQEVESEVGGLVYQSLGTVGFSHPEEAAAFPVPPGYAKLVAVSSRYGLTLFADHAGLCVTNTSRLAQVTESLKEKLPAEQIVPGNDFSRIPLREITNVSFCPDETTVAAVCGGTVHLFQTKDLADLTTQAKAFRVQILGDDDECELIRDLQWLVEFPFAYLALVASERDTKCEHAKLVVGSAMSLDQLAPVAIAEGVRAFAVARGPDDVGDENVPKYSFGEGKGALAAWAPFSGGVVVARLTDGGYTATMKHHGVGPCEDGSVDVHVDGLAFLVGEEGANETTALLALCVDKEDPESHRALCVTCDTSDGDTTPSTGYDMRGAFAIDDDETSGLVGPYAHARRVGAWRVALASHRKAWDNQLCAVRPPSADGLVAPCVLDVEDDRCVPSIPLAGEDEDSNFVVGLALDTTGAGGRMLHPADKSRPRLPQGPLVFVATADARLSVMRLGNLDEELAMRFEASSVKPALAEVPLSPALAGSPAPAPRPSPPGSAVKPSGRLCFESPAATWRGYATSSPTAATAGLKISSPTAVPVSTTPPAPTSGFGAAFLAKASAGYAAAQQALEEEESLASKKSTPTLVPAAPVSQFNFGVAGSSASAFGTTGATTAFGTTPTAFGTTAAASTATALSGFAPPATTSAGFGASSPFGAASAASSFGGFGQTSGATVPAFGTAAAAAAAAAAAPATFTFTGATATPVPVKPGSTLVGFGTLASGGKKEGSSPVEKKAEHDGSPPKTHPAVADSKPAAGGFNFAGATTTFGGGASTAAPSPFASAPKLPTSPFRAAAQPVSGGFDFGGVATAPVPVASSSAPAPEAFSSPKRGRTFNEANATPSAFGATPPGFGAPPPAFGATPVPVHVATPTPAVTPTPAMAALTPANTPTPPNAPPSTPNATPHMDAASDAHVLYGFQLLEAVRAGALDIELAQKQLRDLMVSGTPPPPTPPTTRSSLETTPTETTTQQKTTQKPTTNVFQETPFPAGFAPTRVAASPSAFGKDPTPTWGATLAATRAASAAAILPSTTPPGTDPGAAGLKAVMDDMRSSLDEASAMLDDVVGLVDLVSSNGRAGGAPFGATDVTDVTNEAQALSVLVMKETVEAGNLRPKVAQVWAENNRDETMRAELESLFERAAEDAAAADTEREASASRFAERSARANGGKTRVALSRTEQQWGPNAIAAAKARPLPPALDRMRTLIDTDVLRLTAAMADLERDVEKRERDARRLKQMRKIGAGPDFSQEGRLPWGPQNVKRRQGLQSSVMNDPGSLPASLLRSAGGVSGFAARGFGGRGSAKRGTLVGASGANIIAAASVPASVHHKLPTSSTNKPPTGMEGTAKEETLRELAKRRVLIDSQAKRLDELIAKTSLGESSSGKRELSGKPASPATSNSASSPASLASFSPVRRIPNFMTPGGSPVTPFRTPGSPGSPIVAFHTPAYEDVLDYENESPAGRGFSSPVGARRLAAPSDDDLVETNPVVRAVLSRISAPRVTSTVKKEKPAVEVPEQTEVPVAVAKPTPTPPEFSEPTASTASTSFGAAFNANARAGHVSAHDTAREDRPQASSSGQRRTVSHQAPSGFGGGQSLPDAKAGGFSFGTATASSSSSSSTSTASAFGNAPPATSFSSFGAVPAFAPAFSIGGAATTAAPAAVTFSFAPPTQAVTETVSETAPAKPPPAGGFSFGGASTASPFGTTTTTSSDKPAFSFPAGGGGFSFAGAEKKTDDAETTPAPAKFSFAPAETEAASKTTEAKEASSGALKEAEAEKAQAPKPGGFGAAFLAKASAGYAAAQDALQEDLDKAAKPPPASSAPAFGAAPTSATTFSFGGADASPGFTLPVTTSNSAFGVAAGTTASSTTSTTAASTTTPSATTTSSVPAFGAAPSTSTFTFSSSLAATASAAVSPATAPAALLLAASQPAASSPAASLAASSAAAFAVSLPAAATPVSPPASPVAVPDAPSTPPAAKPTAPVPKTGGFSSAFLAKASTGYAQAQASLQDDLDKVGGGGGASPKAAASTVTSPFGAPTGVSATASPFGAPAAVTGAFGSTTAFATPAKTTGFGGFGASAATAIATPSAFGAAASSASASPFGAATATTGGVAAGFGSFGLGGGSAASPSGGGAGASPFGKGMPASSAGGAFGTPAPVGTTTGAFGTPAATSPGGAFGASNPVGNASPFGGGAFGDARTGGNAFGAAATTGSAFGAAQSTGSAFGATQSTPSAFGAAASGAPSAFGAAQSASSAFGQAGVSPGSAFGKPSGLGAGAPAPFGGGLAPAQGQSAFGQRTAGFGQSAPIGTPASASAFGANSSPSSAFGAKATGVGTGGGFGAFATQGGGFGAAAAAQGASPFGQAAAAGGGFGAAASGGGGFGGAASGGGGFGGAASGGGGFGQASPGGFGQPVSPSGFGQPLSGGSPFGTQRGQNQSAGSGFGQPTSAGGSSFGGGGTSGGGSSFGSGGATGSPFGSGGGNMTGSPFGGGGSNNASPFGQQAVSGSPFGQQNGQNGGFGGQQSSASPFGQPARAAQPFGGAGAKPNPAFTQMRR